MPLPKPSKMISKRYKKPNPLLTPATAFALPTQKQCFLPRELRVRVICTDPDATDDSSSSEDDEEPSLHLQRIAHKRLVREVWLPSPSSLNLHSRGVSGKDESRGPTVKSPCSWHASPASRGGANLRMLPASQQVRSSRVHKEMVGSEIEEEDNLAWYLSGWAEEEDDKWDIDLYHPSRPQKEKSSSEILDLELDAEVMSWINSLQRLP